MKALTLRIDERLSDDLRLVASILGISEVQVVRDAVDRRLRTSKITCDQCGTSENVTASGRGGMRFCLSCSNAIENEGEL